jgi:hypothetical protein
MDPSPEVAGCADLSDRRKNLSDLLNRRRDTIDSELNPNPVSADELIPLLDWLILTLDRSTLPMHEVREEPLPTLPYPYYRLPADMTSAGQIAPSDPQSAAFVRSVLMSGLPY